MKGIKVIDIGSKPEETQFGTCELCFSDNPYIVLEFPDGTQGTVETNYRDWNRRKQMNKKEAIEKIKNIDTLHINDNIAGQQIDMVIKNQVLDIVSQIHEPKKVVVPNFVAERIEKYKRYCKRWDEEARADFVIRYINDLFRFGDGRNPWYFTIDEKFSEWTSKSAYEFIIAILFGYEVEQEKLHTVEIADAILTKITRGHNVQYKMLPSKDVSDVFDKAIYTNRLTETEIKQKDEQLWQFAKEVE